MKTLVQKIRQPVYHEITKKIFTKLDDALWDYEQLNGKSDLGEEIKRIINTAVQNEYVGMMIAFVEEDGQVLVGYSQLNRDLDEYNPYDGYTVAIERAYKFKTKYPNFNKIPFKVRDELPEFLNRVVRYYKDKELVKWAKDYYMQTWKPWETFIGAELVQPPKTEGCQCCACIENARTIPGKLMQ
jgi:hypothetical protein